MIERLLVGASGSIGVMELHLYLTRLRSVATEIQVVLTPAAATMVVPAAVELYCDRLWTDAEPFSRSSNHMSLARWAEKVIVLPASANTLGAAACGLATNVLTTLVMACERPVMFFPNMNPAMQSSAVVRRNIGWLRDLGHTVVDPVQQQVYEAALGRMVSAPAMPLPDAVAALLTSDPVGRVRPQRTRERRE